MFVDIDYPDLMSSKRDVILGTPELQNVVRPIENPRRDCNIFLKSDQYTAVGCDLRNVVELSMLLEKEFEISSCLVLCVAEVSTTYMDVVAANDLIEWTAQYKDVRFCLLEQTLPEGKNHPFARKMLQHFQNLNTPLHSVEKYPLVTDQESRFLHAGYHSACVRTLWDLWQDPSVVPPSTRRNLNQIEPFDEWEEFALFCSHYFVLEALKSTNGSDLVSNTNADISSQIVNRQLSADVSRLCVGDLAPCFPPQTILFASTVAAVTKAGWEIPMATGLQDMNPEANDYLIRPQAFQPGFAIPSPLLRIANAWSYRNQRIWTIKFQIEDQINYKYSQWVEYNRFTDLRMPQQEWETGDSAALTFCDSVPTEDIRRVKLDSAEAFDRLVAEGRPFIMEGLDLGKCTWQWTLQEITTRIDLSSDVTVHEAEGHNMNFQRKNFRYVKKSFRDFIKSCKEGSPQYLRSLATNKPADEPAHFHNDFPSLKDDFRLPPQLGTVMQNEHSSPLRISGPVNMWLHYDVMANVLCQIVGEKVVALYPPSDAVHFQIPPGSSSSPIDIFSDDPQRRGRITHPRQYIKAHLNAGEVLYIPPLWLHSVAPMENFNISVNVFFRNLKSGYAAGRDVYGNRDLQAYENGRKNIDRIVKSFNGLPDDITKAYLERLARELLEKAKMADGGSSTRA
ncbi:MAG: hypothetical protein Q9183_002244 [Haloplaca sp. 2 TL-2023]